MTRTKAAKERKRIDETERRIHRDLRKQEEDMHKRRSKMQVGVVSTNTAPRTRSMRPKAQNVSSGLLHNLKPEEKIVCPHICKWSRALSSGMQVPENDVKIPLPGEKGALVVGKSLPLTNTGQIEIDTIDTGNEGTGFNLYFFPDGRPADNACFFPTGVIGTSGERVIVGSNLGSPSVPAPGYRTAIGYYQRFGATLGLTEQNSRFAPGPFSLNPIQPLFNDEYETVKSPEFESDLVNRTTKLSVEVTVISELQTTRGGVRCWNPDYWPGSDTVVSPAAPPLLSTARRDASYVDFPFGAKRTRIFNYAPAAESINYGNAGIGTAPAAQYSEDPLTVGSRFVLQVYGLRAGETVLVRWICSQEYRGSEVNALTTPSFMTPDVTHLANAIPHLSNYPTGGKPPPTLAEHVAQQKVLASPHATAHALSQGVDLDDPKKTAKASHGIFSDLMSVIDTIGAVSAFL